MTKKAFLNWSSGKDAALALYKCQHSTDFKVKKLLTTINREAHKVTMHGLPVELLKEQAENIGIPIRLIELNTGISADEYSILMEKTISELEAEGFKFSVFGDIFLEDLREYRKQQYKSSLIKPVYPLWKIDSEKLITEFIDSGFKAVTLAVNAKLLDKSFCGREITREFLNNLPSNIDPCGENGEFHTFVYDGPIFKKPVAFKKGQIWEHSFPKTGKDTWDSRFWYCNLLPA